MSDMLVKLYALPDLAPRMVDLAAQGVELRQARPHEKRQVAEWARRHFSESIASWCEVAIEQRPITCVLAVEKQARAAPGTDAYDLPPELLLGFACYDTVARGMFGPEAVRSDRRGQGIGSALLLSCLHAMKAERYAYAVIGWAGAPDFYARAVGATPIEDSEPGCYRGPLLVDGPG
jgi:GNAT superfamily N-acetyltransferase